MKKKPNVLIIQTDQQSSWTLSQYGQKVVSTPNIDRIGNEGITFTNFFTNSACCTPSRGCLLTGRYPHSHGAFFNDMPLNRDEVTLAHLLAANAYSTSYIGKWHLNGTAKRLRANLGDKAAALKIKIPADNTDSFWIPRERSMGFEDCRYMFEVSHGKKVLEDESGNPISISSEMGDEKSYPTDWLTHKAVDYIKNAGENPFFLMLSIPDPHDPYSVRPPYDGMYNPENMPLPATFHQNEYPSWLVNESNKRWVKMPDMTAGNMRRVMAQYCGEIKCIDDNVGKLFTALDNAGILDHTIIIFTSDHGDYMGEHGLIAKNAFYETAYRVPMLLRWPEEFIPAQYCDHLWSTVDVLPTIAGLLDIDTSGREQGRDASMLFHAQQASRDDEVFSYSTTRTAVAVFTPQYEMVLNSTHKENLLFDRVNDPGQTNNLFRQSAMLTVKKDLYKRIIKHAASVQSPERDWLMEYQF